MNDCINKNPYEDIIRLPRPVSKVHKPMSRSDRAAQFSPFAALTGYESVLSETARLTDRKIELDEEREAILNARLNLIIDQAPLRPLIKLTYFLPDQAKKGGEYITLEGNLRRVDESNMTLILIDGKRIPIADLFDIQIDAGLEAI